MRINNFPIDYFPNSIVGPVIYLRQSTYTQDQMIFPFMQGALIVSDFNFDIYVVRNMNNEYIEKSYWEDFKKQKVPKKKKQKADKSLFRTRERFNYVKDNKHLLPYEIDQALLPFVEWRDVNSALGSVEITLLRETNWPGWNNNKGKPYNVKFECPKSIVNNIDEWCYKNLKGRYYTDVWGSPNNDMYMLTGYFQLTSDALLFKMTWN